MTKHIEIIEHQGDYIRVLQNETIVLLHWSQVASLLTAQRSTAVSNQPTTSLEMIKQAEVKNQI